MPGQTGGVRGPPRPAFRLQWRAGQLPGQTHVLQLDQYYEVAHLQWRAGQLPGQTVDSARPSAPIASLQWRAGQLPGQTTQDTLIENRIRALQWRAGQLPGQTPGMAHRGNQSLFPSMEGRAIARPNPAPWQSPSAPPPAFNGGPGNCPAKLIPHHPTTGTRPPLQWRAGQLPGQTSHRGWSCSTPSTFNGGPGNCPAKPRARPSPRPPPTAPSMEGRAIARPNHGQARR